jgi:hypothetical protein
MKLLLLPPSPWFVPHAIEIFFINFMRHKAVSFQPVIGSWTGHLYAYGFRDDSSSILRNRSPILEADLPRGVFPQCSKRYPKVLRSAREIRG